MSFRRLIAVALLSSTALLSQADATAIKWARIADALTMDPHSQNEGPTIVFQHQIYESLMIRNDDGSLEPTLALSWKVTEDPTVWEFKLREGVKFHQGQDFTADDVIFSLNRALLPSSDHRGAITSIAEVTAPDKYTVRIKTKAPNPVLPAQLTNIFMMSKAWCEANNATKPQDFKNKEESFSARNTNGTGAFVLVSREQDVKSVMKRNDSYWGKANYPNKITELTYVTIKSDPTRVAALLSGEVDFVQDVPVQDIARLQGDNKFNVTVGPENRIIFFGMNVVKPELTSSDIKGKNPFADLKVRAALSMALDRDAIQRVVMRGQSIPAGVVLPPFVNGYTKALDVVEKPDVNKAKALLAEAGYKDGFSVTLHCPNDRYINDEGICQAAVGMWARIGVKANLVSQSKSIHFPLIAKQPPETEFYMLGWGVPTYDSAYILDFLYHTRGGAYGGFNGSGYSKPALDEKIKAISATVDIPKRNATIAEIWSDISKDSPYIPVHHQMVAHAMKKNMNVRVHPDNGVYWKTIDLK